MFCGCEGPEQITQTETRFYPTFETRLVFSKAIKEGAAVVPTYGVLRLEQPIKNRDYERSDLSATI